MLIIYGKLYSFIDDSHFLPQDKVCEFAQMSPQKLLEETQRAAGQVGMTDMHLKLTELKQEQVKQKMVMKKYHLYPGD